jgi:hypothetical protein
VDAAPARQLHKVTHAGLLVLLLRWLLLLLLLAWLLRWWRQHQQLPRWYMRIPTATATLSAHPSVT